MENLTLSKVYKSDKNKDGEPFKAKDGKKFWKVAVKFSEYGEEWFSCLAFREDDKVMQLEEGEMVNVILTENNGFKNFKLPTRIDMLELRLERLERALKDSSVELPDQTAKEREEMNSIDPDSIPF